MKDETANTLDEPEITHYNSKLCKCCHRTDLTKTIVLDIENTQNKTEKKSDGREIVCDKERFFRPVEFQINFQEKEYRNTNGNCMRKQLLVEKTFMTRREFLGQSNAILIFRKKNKGTLTETA